MVAYLTISYFSFRLLIPAAGTLYYLMVPHFTLGLGIGAIDAALVPLLASTVDMKASPSDNESIASNSISHYGAVYAIQQMAVSLAYSVGKDKQKTLIGKTQYHFLF